MKKVIKRYNDFVKTNEEFQMGEVKPAPVTTPTPTETPRPVRPSVVPTERPSVEDEPLAKYDEKPIEGGDLNALYDVLEGSEIKGNVVYYNGYEIDLPSETGNFRVDGHDLKTNDVNKVVDYLNNPKAQAEAQKKRDRMAQRRAQSQVQAKTETGLDPEAQAQKGEVVDLENIPESKSYKFTRKFKSKHNRK